MVVWPLAADASALTLVAEQPHAHGDSVNSVDFSPDGSKIVSGSSDHKIRMWGALCLHVLLVVVSTVIEVRARARTFAAQMHQRWRWSRSSVSTEIM